MATSSDLKLFASDAITALRAGNHKTAIQKCIQMQATLIGVVDYGANGRFVRYARDAMPRVINKLKKRQNSKARRSGCGRVLARHLRF